MYKAVTRHFTSTTAPKRSLLWQKSCESFRSQLQRRWTRKRPTSLPCSSLQNDLWRRILGCAVSEPIHVSDDLALRELCRLPVTNLSTVLQTCPWACSSEMPPSNLGALEIDDDAMLKNRLSGIYAISSKPRTKLRLACGYAPGARFCLNPRTR